ncbi:unnamed protein product, partial [marine sediment metagenome]
GLILQAVRGALGVNQGNNQGGNLLDTLKLLGFNSLREAISSGKSEAFLPEDIKIPGTDTILPKGCPVSAVPMFIDSSGRSRMADAFENVLMPVAKTYVESHGGPGDGGHGGPGAAGRAQGITKEPETQTVNCPDCGQAFQVQAEDIGKETECPGCKLMIQVTEEQPAAKPSRVKRPKPPKPPERDILFCECGQQLDVTGREVLSEVECPACGAVGKLTKPDEPLPAVEPAPKKPLSLGERNEQERLL